MFVWAHAGDVEGEVLSDKILEAHKIFITPGSIFGKEGRSYVRISLCTPEKRLEEALDRLSA